MSWSLVSTTVALALLGAGTNDGADPGARPTVKIAAQHHHDAAAYDRTLQQIDHRRRKLGALLRRAETAAERARVRAAARRFVTRVIREEIFSAWLGTPWGLGRRSTMRRPHEPGMTVGCSYFVTSVLQNAGLRLSNRYRFAQAPAVGIQRALTPGRRHLHRYVGVTPAELARRVAALGDGLYVIGLNIHVGFVVVQEGEARIVHASYTEPTVVVSEPVARSQAIINSQRAGYVVSPLFQDQRLIDHWLSGRPVPFRR